MSDELEATKSVADAAGEVAKATGKAIDAANNLGSFLGKLTEGPLLQVSGMIEDRLEIARKLGRLKLLERLAEKCAARGISPETMKPLPTGATAQVLEAAALEDANEVQDLWAELLANAVDPKSDVGLQKVYITLLKDFGAAEATLLRLLGTFLPYQTAPGFKPTSNDFAGELDALRANLSEAAAPWRAFSPFEQQVAIGNLSRLGCIKPPLPTPPQLGRLLQPVRLAPYARGPGSVVTKVDIDEFNVLLRWIQSSIVAAGGGDPPPLPKEVAFRMNMGGVGPSLAFDVPELSLALTALGAELLKACAKPPAVDGPLK